MHDSVGHKHYNDSIFDLDVDYEALEEEAKLKKPLGA